MKKDGISYDDTPAAKFDKEFQENAVVTVISDGGWHSDVDVTAVDSLISCAYDHLEKEAGESCDCKTVQEDDGIHYYMYAEGYIGDVEALIDSGKMSLRAKEGSEEMKLPDGNTYGDLEHYSLYEVKEPEKLFDIMKNLYHADQVTLRVLYASDDGRPENVWVRENAADRETAAKLYEFVHQNGTLLGRLPYGAYKYGLDGMSVVVDSDSMGKESDDVETYKYLILRPDCRLYSSWDDPASRVF